MSTPFLLPSCQQIQAKAAQLAFFCFGAFCVAFPSGYSVSFIFLFLMALPRLWHKTYWQELSIEMQMLAILFLAYFLFSAIATWLDHGTLKQIDRPSRLFALALMLPLICRYKPTFAVLFSGIGTGAITAGAVAAYEKLYLHEERAFTNIMPIQSGDISLSLGLLSLCAFAWYYRQGARRWMLFYVVAALGGVAGSFLSGSRGGWVLLPLLLIIWYRSFCHWYSARLKLAIFAAITLCLLALFIPQLGVKERMQETRSEISEFLSGNNPDTSTGLRFQFWQSAWKSFLEKPLLGWGPNSIRESQKEQFEAGKLSASAYQFNSHAHNQFLDHMAKYGLAGLGMLLALFLIPWLLGNKIAGTGSKERTDYTLVVASRLHILATMNYCLSQAFLNHNSGMIFYPFMVTLLLCALDAHSSKEASSTASS